MAEGPGGTDEAAPDGPTGLSGWLRRVFGGLAPSERTRGYPTSSNRASSMNLFWDLPGRFVEVGVTLTILDDPRTDDLYFWALQVGFEDAASGRRQGAAHTGPQWAAQHPGHGAVNWGGYCAVGELDGSRGWLPSASGNANSVDYPWRVGVPYRLTVARATGDLATGPSAPRHGVPETRTSGPHAAAPPPGFTAWRATITPLAAGPDAGVSANVGSPAHTAEPQVIRDLWAPGDRLVSPMVWSEVFARCDAVPVRVAWSNPTAIDERGGVHRVQSARVNYQSVADGGCSNTEVSVTAAADGPAWLQSTSTERRTRPGTPLRLADPR